MNYKACTILTSIVMSGLMSGCISLCLLFLPNSKGTNTEKYIDNSPIQVSNEIVVSRPQSEVWDILVKELSKSFYVINNIDKESRIINVSFSSNNPSEYIDCGKAYRTYAQGKKTETYNYDVAQSAKYKLAIRRRGEPPQIINYAVVRRETFLDGRSNIYIAPGEKDKNSTIVTVNTRYILNVKAKIEGFSQHICLGSAVSFGRLPEETWNIAFNTNKPVQNYIGDTMISCFSKGKLEKEILDMTMSEKK